MTATVKWSRVHRCFLINNKTARGLHPTLQKTFYPDYEYGKAVYGHNGSGGGGGGRGTGAKITRFKPGMRSGRMVDNQVTHVVKLMKKLGIPLRVFTNPELQKRYARQVSGLSVSDCRLITKKLAPGTVKLCQALLRLRLTPCAAQVPVGCESLHLATACDIVCEDAQRRKIVVEVKTGFTYHIHKHTGHRMRNLSASVYDSPYNQHQLQLALTYAMYRHTFPTHKTGPPVLLRIDPTGVNVVELDAWAGTHLRGIVAAVRV